MSAIIALGCVAFLLCLLITPLTRDLFLRYGIVDHPDAARKLHAKPIPRVGGIAIVLSYALAMGVMYLLAPEGARIYIQHGKLLFSLLPAAGIIFITGLVDDLVHLKPWQKLSGQIVAASIAVSLGVRISMFHGYVIPLWITIPVSMLWLIGCANAVNLIDGMDGLASGVGLFATLTTLLAALFSGNVGLAVATVPLAGCLFAFLRYNFSPASIFLGDCGSLTIGFMLGCFGLIWSHHGGTLLGMSLPLMALALPLIDVVLAIGRRTLRKVPIFKGDRGHIHHMVLARGFSPHVAALILYAFCAAVAILALLETFYGFFISAPVLLAFFLLVWIGINYLGYVELKAIGRLFSRKRILRLLREEIYLHELDRSLTNAKTVEDFWHVVRAACAETSFSTAQMYFCETTFSETFDSATIDPALTVTLGLGQNGYLMLMRSASAESAKSLMPVLEYLQAAASLKEASLLRAASYAGAAA